MSQIYIYSTGLMTLVKNSMKKFLESFRLVQYYGEENVREFIFLTEV